MIGKAISVVLRSMSSMSTVALPSKPGLDITLELSGSTGVKMMSSNGVFKDAVGDGINPFALDSSSASLAFCFWPCVLT